MDTNPNQFSDTEGRTWAFRITLADVRRVKDETGVDLLEVVDVEKDALAKLAADIVALFDVMASVLRPQLTAQGMTADDLGMAMDEAAVDAAVRALFEGVIGFFRAEKAATLRTAFRKVWTAADRIAETNREKAQAVVASPEFDRTVEAAVAASLGPGVESSS